MIQIDNAAPPSALAQAAQRADVCVRRPRPGPRPASARAPATQRRAPSRTLASPRRLTGADHHALGAFRLAIKTYVAVNPIRVGELADSLLVRNHSALGLVARLQARGLTTRAQSARDRRRVLLALTPSAELILETIFAQQPWETEEQPSDVR